MTKTSRSNLFAKLFESKLLILGGLVIVVLFSVAVTKELLRRYEINKEIAILEEEAGALESRQQELSGLIEYFQSDAFQEREARKRLGLQKEGESVIILPQVENQILGTTTREGEVVVLETQSNSIKWWNYFFNN